MLNLNTPLKTKIKSFNSLSGLKELSQYIEILPEVEEALQTHKPVVALESTIISHGFSYPQNIECARVTEKNVREQGAVPATLAIINGKIKVGLTDKNLLYLAETKGIRKASRRDVPLLVALKQDGATTVAATMLLASMAGIKVFATGGIGGVHRNAQNTFDISADLEELAETEVVVVCAGAKSILDIGLTLEYLETKGVPVIGFRTEDFPGFYTRTTGCKVDYSVASVEDIARAIRVKENLALKGGIVVANPIPEQYEMDYQFITDNINAALAEAEESGVRGKEITPFLLDRIHKTTGGKSVEANKQLVFNNARLAAWIASALTHLPD
ncbi:MAG: pseudouridine-5'-phosphate glycosidase [Spirochaetota bacterium]